MSIRVARGLDKALAVLDRTSQIAVWIGGGLLIASALLICAEIFLRRIGITTRGADEFSYYVLAISTTWALSFALLRKAHIRIDAVYVRLPAAIRAAFDVLALLALATFALLSTYSVTFGLLRRSILRGSTSNTIWQTPLWIPQSLFLLGLILFTITSVLLLLRVVWALAVERDYRIVDRYAGGQTFEDEIEDALGDSVVAKAGGRP